MSNSEEKPLAERLTALEESVQPFMTKAESGWAKADAVGATAAATGVSTEFTGIGTGVKLWSAEFDLKQHLADNKDKRLERSPEILRAQLSAAQSDIARIRSSLTNADGKANRAHQRISDLSRDLNQKIRRKADKSAVGAANNRQNSQISALRSSQVSALRREAQQANANVRQLNNEITRLNSRF
ncbi:hypothetical protein ACFQ7F_42535 [Streptomyces sp. NPDC056486]|uniref:hypothetical protein n=1 Tax=Streptomyces sp. NPDC056486 TaxID=3345835 RepID=UPI0036A725EF